MTVILYILFFFFFFNDTATTEIYTLSLHDALPILVSTKSGARWPIRGASVSTGVVPTLAFPVASLSGAVSHRKARPRSEEHTSELQSRSDLVCRLLLEKKKRKIQQPIVNDHRQLRC